MTFQDIEDAVEHEMRRQLATHQMTLVKNERLAELLEAEAILGALEEAGVDNWEGYSNAMNNLEGN